jgi:hypothetical protein
VYFCSHVFCWHKDLLFLSLKRWLRMCGLQKKSGKSLPRNGV